LSGKTILSAMERKDTLEAALKEISEMARKEEEEEEEHHHHHHHHDDDGECDDPECECHHHHHDDDDEDEEHEHHHHHHHHDEDEECDDPECECHHHHHDDEDEDEEHEHHHHHHHHHGHDADEVFTSWGVETANKYSRDEIEGILKKLDDAAAYGAILRAKGVVPGVDGQWIHYDYVPEEQDVRTGPAAFTGRICVIGSKLNEDALKALFRV
ncbi:MAG: GTP-binding protein, partial [Clostridia bacterium]|nr:GTP-binding protein [Clostridia bacterium]